MAGEQMKFADFQRALAAKDGSFSLSLVCNPAQLSDEEINLICQTYQQALNNSSCPCGSSKTFEECCKLMWRTWERQFKALSQEPPKEIEKENSKPKPIWVAKIGIFEGTRNLIIDLPEGGKRASMEELHSILLQAEKNVYSKILLESAMQMFTDRLQQPKHRQVAVPRSVI